MYERYESIFAELEPPFAFVDLDLVGANADRMVASAGGKPIRIASKSVRCRPLLRRMLDRSPGFQGLLNLTLPEAVWLYEDGFRNLVVAYPWTGSAALVELAGVAAGDPDGAPAVMVDSIAHLELIEAAVPAGASPIRVCIDLDVGYWPLGGRLKFGPKRSPIRTAEAAARFAAEIDRRPAVRLVGVMAYEGQVAGVADAVPGRRLENLAIRAMKRLSVPEVSERRRAMVAAVRSVGELEFVNGGGTGSISSTAAEPAVTEVAAGSGFYAPMLFQYYRALALSPAAGYALPVSRKPAPGIATALGGGYVASGSARADRLPVPAYPAGLRLDPLEGAGEAQTPLLGRAAAQLRVGDRVYLRHAKAGELCERFNALYLIEGERVVEEVPTYRGEGQCFL
ncbi:alanine racemase [Actinobacteria bacterium SCGC AG-212-D09]|nr:alanine racemase [Actinobacteria bacterium SCGC AG-212-D09]